MTPRRDKNAANTQTNNTPAGEGPASQTQNREKTWKQKTTRVAILTAIVLLLAFVALRWAGSTTYRGTVQRVYEKQAEYRVEFTELDGNVHVVGNTEIRFPYFKVNTANLHAELNRMSRTGDIVDIKVWGLRAAWFSMFPNVLTVEFVRSDSDRTRDKANQIAEKVISLLSEKQILKGGENIKDDLVRSIEEGLKSPEKPIGVRAK